jgi:hypothetical protein
MISVFLATQPGPSDPTAGGDLCEHIASDFTSDRLR